MSETKMFDFNIRNLQRKNDELKSQIETYKLALDPNTNINQLKTETKNLKTELQKYEALQTKVIMDDFVFSPSTKISDCTKYYKSLNIRDEKEIISDQYNFIFYLISKLKSKELSLKPSEYKSNSLNITTIQDLTTNKGWKYKQIIPSSSPFQKIVSFIGDIEVGKTHILNKLFNLTLPETSTNSIQFINPNYDNSLLIIDTPGLNKNASSITFQYNHIKEIKQIDYIIKSIAVHNANIIFYITKSFTTKTKKEIDKIHSILSSSSDQSIKELVVLINCPFIYSEQQYKEVKNSFFNINSFKENDGLFVQTDISDNQKSLSCLTVYAIYCPYYLENLLSKRNIFIENANLITINDITNDLILKPLSIAGVELFNVKANSAKCEDNIIKLLNYDQSQIKNSNPLINTNKESKYIYQDDLSYWKSLENENIGFAYYVKDDKSLFIEIQCQYATKASIKYNGLKAKDHQFAVVIQCYKNEDALNQSEIKYSNRKNSVYNLTINVPSSWGDIASKGKYKSMSYKKGMLLFQFDYQLIRDSIDD